MKYEVAQEGFAIARETLAQAMKGMNFRYPEHPGSLVEVYLHTIALCEIARAQAELVSLEYQLDRSRRP